MAKKRNRYESNTMKELDKRRQQRLSSSVEPKSTTAKDVGMRILGERFGKDTFEQDLKNVNERVNSVSGNWQTQETMENARASVESMQKRLDAYQSYQQRYGGADLGDLSKGYKSLLRDWDKLSETYAGFENEEAFNRARTKAQMDKKFSGLSYEDVQEQLKQYDKDSEEYKYLSNFTNYRDLRDFEKALTSAKTNVNITRNAINPNPIPKNNKFDVIEQAKKNVPNVADGSAIAHNPDALGNRGEYIKELETLKNQYALDHKFDLYKGYMDAEDFEETSKYSEDVAGIKYSWNGIRDIKNDAYAYINNPTFTQKDIFGQTWESDARTWISRQASIYGADTKDTTSSFEKKGYNKLNEEEVAVYNSIYHKEGEEKAQQFLDDMEVVLTKRVYDEATQRWEDMADESPVLMSALSIPANLVGGMTGGLESLGDAIQGKEYNPYGYHKLPANFSADTRQYVSENIEEATEGMDIFGQNIPSFLYQTGMSIGDTAVGGATLGSSYTLLMGTSSAQQTAKDLKEAGATDEQIMRGSLASGLIEVVTEKVSFDNLIKAKSADSLLKIFKETAKQAGIEGSEEFFAEVANITFDNWNRGKNSDTYKMYEEYLARGFSEEEAERMTKQELNKQIGFALAGGMISGGVLGGTTSISNHHDLSGTGSRIRENDRISEVMDLQGLTPEESDAFKLYSEYAKKGITADNISDARIGNLYRTSEREARETWESKKTTTEQKADAINRLSKIATISTSKSAEEKSIQQRAESLNKGEVTEVTATGNSTKIEGIKIEDGKTIVRTGEGEFDVDAMTFSDKDAKLISYAENMGETKGNLMLSQYDGKADVSSFVNSFNLAYSYGEIGMGLDSVLKNKGVLTEAQVSEIYKTAMTNKSNERDRIIKEINEKHSGNVFVEGKFDDSIIDYDGTVTDGSKVAWKDLTKTQRNAIAFAKGFSKATGVNITFIRSEVKDGKRVGKNGSYNPNTNTIEIDVYAGIIDAKAVKDSIIPTLSHEMTHWMKAKSPAMYSKIREHALKTLAMSRKLSSDDRVTDEMNRMKEAHSEMIVTEEMAIDEIVAKYCEDMLANSNKVRKLLNQMSEKEQQSFIAKVKDTFNNLMEWANELLSQYKSSSKEAEILREYKNRLKEVSKMWDKALEEAIKSNQSMQAEGINDIALLKKNGVLANENNATVYSVRYLLDEDKRNKVASDLVNVLGVSRDEAMEYLNAEASIASIVLNPKHQEFLDYEADENEVAIKKNSDYPQGTVDFSNICAKRRDFTSVMNRVMSKFKDHIFLSTDLAKIRTIMSEEKITIPCGICYVEDRRQLDSIVAEDFLKALELYRSGSKTRPDGKPFNANQLKALKMVENDTYTPSIYELITLEGRNALKDKDSNMESAWVNYNNARGMQSVRLLTNEAEYRREILGYSKTEVKRKNDLGGLRIYSFSDAEIPHLIDLVQVITDSASKGLAIQGYTKVNWYAKMIRNTGVKINRSLIPAGELGYHVENGKAVLDYDTVEGIDINDKDFFDSTEYDNVGNILIGINEVQIRTAMLDPFVDYIIPFHTGQSGEVLREKGIDKWQNYKNSQSERKISDGKKSEKQINIYTDVIQKAEAEGNPIKNKVQFVEKFLSVCKENGLIPRFSEFLNTDENGDYIYTEGYHKFIIDFKTFHPITGEYLPQMPVAPNFDNEFIEQTLMEFSKQEKGKQAELQPKMDKAVARIEKEVIGTQYSDRAVRTLADEDYKSVKEHFGTTQNFNVAGYMLKDGAMLDFSGKHWGDTTSRSRQVDHRDIQEVITDDNNGFDSMVNMIANGNIRLMPETGGINLAVAPTSDQLKVLERYINNFRGEVVVDIDKVGGDTIKSFTYDRGTSAKKILDDIDNYFRGGRQSELMMFHTMYSDRDYMDAVNRGDMETAQKMVDEVAKKNGYDTIVFHGTDAEKINVFVGTPDRMEANSPNLIKGYFSDQESYANDYGRNTFKYYINTDNFLYIEGMFDSDEMTEYLKRHGVTGVKYNNFISDEEAVSAWLEDYGEVIDPWMFFNESGGNITEQIRKAGYKGVYWDEGYFTEEGGTAYMPFESNLIKSADAVTYDDEGNVIPLSKRFNVDNSDIRYSDRVTDKDTLDFLNEQIENGEYATVYRSFQIIDGGLYAPMNAVDRDEDGKNKRLGYRSELGQWEMATESPEIAQRYIDSHPDAPYAKFDLDGVDNKTNAVAYNPYLHASNLVLNDQFSGAYRRNLVTVECRVPLSEIGAYRAKYAKDATGWADWKAGTVAGKLTKVKPELTRRLFLSRYMLPVRIVPDSEVAQMYKDYLDGTDISVPWNVVTPSLRQELEKKGVKVSYNEVKFGSKIVRFDDVFGAKYSDRDTDSWLKSLSIDELIADLIDDDIDFDDTQKKKTRATRRVDGVNKRLKEIGLSFNGTKSLAWTDERINKYLGGGYYGSSNPKYAQAYITYMSPQQFLNLTLGSKTYTLDRIQNESESYGDVDIEKLGNSSPIFLQINEGKGKAEVTGHEGRHRMYMLGKAGVERVPVLLFDYNTKYDKTAKSELKLTAQKFNEDDFISKSRDVVVNDVIPFSQGNRDLIVEKFGSGNKIADIRFSDRDNVSVYDAMGETERIIDENARLKADIETLKANISDDEVGVKKFRSLADYLKKLAGSQYNRETLGDELKEVYTYIQTTDVLQWNNVFAKTYDVARRMMNLNPNVSSNYFKEVMSNVRKDKVTLSEDQRAEAEKLFGNYGDFHRAVFGRINVVKEGTPLSEMWKEWSKRYPAIFDANLGAEKQVEALVDIVNALKASSSMMGEYEQEEAIRHLATEIYNQFWNIASDKSDAVQKAKANHRKMMEDLRKEYEQRQKEKTLHPVGETALKYEKLLRQTMQRDKAEVKKARELGKKRLDAYKDRVERNAKIQTITKKAMTLNQWITKNSRDEHIPEVMKAPVAYLLNSIDFSSKQLLGMRGGSNAGMPTKKDLSFSKALEQVHDMVQKINSAQIGEDEITEIYGSFADFPAGFADDIRELSSSVNDVMRTVGDNAYVLNEMTLEQLETLDKIVTIIKSTVTKMNKFLAIRHAEGVANLSQQSIVEMDQLGKIKQHEGFRGKIDKLIDWGNALPYYTFKRFGKGGQMVYEALQEGWDKFAFHVKSIIDYAESVYTSDEVKEWSKDIKTFDVLEPATDEAKASKDYKPKYQKLQITVPQIMSLYALQKREQAKGHLMGGGMRVSDIKSKNDVISQTEGVILSQSEIDTIVNSLTARQKKVADALQKFMNTVCTDWGNEVSMLRFGFEGFGEENYFPIQSDKNNLAVNDETEQNNSLFRLLNMSFTKGTIQKANNRIVISDIFDVFAQHTSDMAKYNALALPVLDSFKWYNYKEKAKKGETQFVTKSLKQSMENAFGKDAQNYFTTFLRDINGEHSAGRDSVGGGFFTNAKIASVGFNMRVVALQPTSYLRASAIIDSKYLTKALVHKPKTEMAQKHCGIALWKSLGFYDINVQNGVADMIKHEETVKDRIVEASMKGAEVADKITWGYLWNACELEVRDKQKNLKVGSKEFYEAIANRLREVIYATQVVDSTMTRSHMMRSKDGRDKMLTAFASEPTLSYNMLQDVYYDWKLTERRTGSKQTAFAQNGKKMARVITAYTVTNLLCALVEAGFDAFRDDEDEMTAEEFMELYLKNFGSDMSILGKIPYAKEIISMMQGYSSSRTDTQWMQYLANTFNGIMKLAEGKGNAYTTAKNFMRAFSQATGLPFYNAYRDFMAMVDELDILTADEVEEEFNDTIGDIFPSLKSK